MTRPVARPIVFAVVRSAPTPWLLLAVAAVMAAGRPADAQTTTWTRGSNTSAWATGGNWSGSAAPTTTTVAVIDTKADLATTTIALNGDGRVAQQVLFTGAQTKYLWGNGPTSTQANNRDLTLTQGITADETSGPAFVGYTTGTSYRLLDVVLNGSQAITNNSAATLSFGDPVGQTISGTVYTGSRIQSGSNVVGTVTFTGTGTGDIRVNGQIVNGSGTARLAVTVDRPGRSVIFTNTNTYSGDTTIAAGTLALAMSSGAAPTTGRIGTGGLILGGASAALDVASLAAASVSLSNVSGIGTLSGSGKTLIVTGSLRPGGSGTTGILTVAAGLTLDLAASAGGFLELTDPTFVAGSFDQLAGAGTVNLGGPLTLEFSNGPYTAGSQVDLFATGGLSGAFSSVTANGLTGGLTAEFDSATGVVTIVPEPATGLAAAVGGGCGVWRLRRWRRQGRRE